MIDIPDELIATQVRYNGAAGRAFVAGLPALVEGFLGRWGLRPDGPVAWGVCALVVPVVRVGDGRRSVLKCQLVDEETAGEPVALRLWGTAGAAGGAARAVRLLEWDAATGTMLLERLDARRPLSGVAEAREAVRVVAGLLAGLTAVRVPEGAGLRGLGAAVVRMLEAEPEVVRALADEGERRLVADCAAAVREVAGEPGDRLLHWDLHFGNVLAAEGGGGDGGPWVAIDPKPLVGDPGFDLFPALTDRFDAGDVGWRFDVLTGALGLDRERARAWTLARVLQNACWERAEGGRRLVPAHAEVARRLLGGGRRA